MKTNETTLSFTLTPETAQNILQAAHVTLVVATPGGTALDTPWDATEVVRALTRALFPDGAPDGVIHTWITTRDTRGMSLWCDGCMRSISAPHTAAMAERMGAAPTDGAHCPDCGTTLAVHYFPTVVGRTVAADRATVADAQAITENSHR